VIKPQGSKSINTLHHRLGLFLVKLPLFVADTDPYAADFRVVTGTDEAIVATVVNYGAAHEITEEDRESDCEYQDRSIREGKSLARLFAASPEMHEALECHADLARFKGCNFSAKCEIVEKWLPRIISLLPDSASEHSVIANWTHYAFTQLPVKLGTIALAKARGEQPE
jgi:hypothetical protein